MRQRILFTNNRPQSFFSMPRDICERTQRRSWRKVLKKSEKREIKKSTNHGRLKKKCSRKFPIKLLKHFSVRQSRDNSSNASQEPFFLGKLNLYLSSIYQDPVNQHRLRLFLLTNDTQWQRSRDAYEVSDAILRHSSTNNRLFRDDTRFSGLFSNVDYSFEIV